MNLNYRVVIGGLLGGITAFLSGWLIYGRLMYDYFENTMLRVPGVMKDTMHPGIREWVSLMVSQFSLAFLLAFVFSKFSNINAMRGMIAGAVVVMLISLHMNCSIFFQMNLIGKKMIISDALVSLVYGGVIGMVVGWYSGRKTVIPSA